MPEQNQELLVRRIRELEARVHELEGSDVSRSTISNEADAVIAAKGCVFHGPDTVERLSSFSLEAIRSELQSSSPTLLRLFQEVGNTSRNQPTSEGIPSVEEMKAIAAICTLLNARAVMECSCK